MDTFTLTKKSRKNLLNCFKSLFGKNSNDYRLVIIMTDSQLCKYWSAKFD